MATHQTTIDAITSERRRRVAALVLRKYSQREIQRILHNEGIINERTSKPWCLHTIHSDIKWLVERWREESVQDIIDHRARLLADRPTRGGAVLLRQIFVVGYAQKTATQRPP